MKAYRGMDVKVNIFLTSALAGGEWAASRRSRFTPGEWAAGTSWVGGWVDPRDGRDDVENRTFLTLQEIELRHHWSSSPYPVAIPTTLSRLLSMSLN
jgi:hypothetical protein